MSDEERKPTKEYHGDGTYTITTVDGRKIRMIDDTNNMNRQRIPSAIERTMQAGEKLGWWGDYAARFVAFPMIIGGTLGAMYNMVGLIGSKNMADDHYRQKGRLYCQSIALGGVGLCGLIYMYQERLENDERTIQFLEDQKSGAIDARMNMTSYRATQYEGMEQEPENGVQNRFADMRDDDEKKCHMTKK